MRACLARGIIDLLLSWRHDVLTLEAQELGWLLCYVQRQDARHR